MTLSGMIEPYLLMIMVSSVAVFTVIIIAVEYDWSVKSLLHKLKLERSTPLQKEIKAERKEIARLERLKVGIDELEELKRRREKLFNNVYGERWECTSCGDEFETLRDYGKHISEAHHS